MDLSVLPLEGVIERVSGLNETVKDFNTFFAALRKCPGNDDKPLRVLQTKSGGRLMAKFAYSDDQRHQSLQDEWNNMQKVSGPHVAQIVWAGKHEGNIAILTEFIEPYGKIHTMRELSSLASDLEWRSAFFQVLFTLASLQAKHPGFRHNDLKADNVLVTCGPSQSYSLQYNGLRRTFFLPAGVSVKLIDFELASTPDKTFTNQLMEDRGDSLVREFGIVYKNCEMYDVHLLSYDALRSQNAVMSAFLTFMTFFIPKKFFDPLCLTSQFRLKVQDQEDLQASLYPQILLRMMCHPYFFHFRGETNDRTEYSIR